MDFLPIYVYRGCEEKKRSMKYSIVIPVYNAEATLKRCLDSLLTQDYPDAELLLINDGSTDRSEEICREYAERYPNVICYSQPNAGVSAARNLGLDQAGGTYILFVDSDDYVNPDYFVKLDRILADGVPDLVFFSYCLVGEQVYTIRLPDATRIPTGDIAGLTASLLRRQQLNALWSKVFLRDIIESHHLRFDESLDIDEDVNFIFSYILRIDRLRLSSEILYNTSLENPESLTRKKRDYLCEQLNKAGLRRESMVKDASLQPKSRKTIEKALSWLYYRNAYSAVAELFKYQLQVRERRGRIEEICHTFLDSGIRPYGIRSRLISLPVRLCASGLIDHAAQRAVRKRKQ